MNSGMVRYTEVQLYIDFTLTVPTCNPIRPYREGEGKRENLGTRPGSQRLRAWYFSVDEVFRNPTPKYPAARERKPLVTQ